MHVQKVFVGEDKTDDIVEDCNKQPERNFHADVPCGNPMTEKDHAKFGEMAIKG